METRLLTYADLGEALGITPASAKRLAIRRAWPKQPGNDGKARVSVPIERLVVERKPVAGDVAEDATGDNTGDDTGVVTGVTEALNRHIQRLETALEKAEAEREKVYGELNDERARATALQAEAAAAPALRAAVEALKVALESERNRIADLRAERDRLLVRRRSWWPFRRAI